MPSSFTSSLRLTLPVTGENSGTWGDLVNTGITNLVDASVAGYAAVTMMDADYTLTSVNGAADEARKMLLNISGTLTATRNVICPTASKLYFIKNATTGGFAITLKTSAGTGISVPNGRSMVLMCDGTNVREAVDFTTTINTTNLAYTGTLTGGTGVVNLGSGQFEKNASGNIGIGTGGNTYANKLTLYAGGATAHYMQVANGSTGIASTNGLRLGVSAAGLGEVYSTNALVIYTANSERIRIDSSGNTIPILQVTPPTLTTNQQMVFNLTSDTNLRISVRGTDGVMRTANITLA